jgi:hypothetical protein
MIFRTKITSAKEVLFVGEEFGKSRDHSDWLQAGRWKVSMPAVEAYLTERLRDTSFGTSVDQFVFCFEIADFELWGAFFEASADYTSYRPKHRAVWSVGQLRWSDVKDLPLSSQLTMLRGAVQASILRIGTKARKPRDFRYADFSVAVEQHLAKAPERLLAAVPVGISEP